MRNIAAGVRCQVEPGKFDRCSLTVLPARFGGSALDYQLVERADRPSGRGQIQLLVNPSLGDLDVGAVLEVFLTALGGGTGGERLMEMQWRASQVVELVRAPARKTASGKILHLHLQRDSA